MIIEKPSIPIIIWLTDIHLNFVGRSAIEELCETVRKSEADSILITGDIATSHNLSRYLDYLANYINIPIYFVLGNHDFYGSSILQVKKDVANVVKSHENLIWLTKAGVVELSASTCLIGHEGLADGRLGDPERSTVMLNDYFHIEELAQPTKALRLEVQHKLGDEAAAYLKKQLIKAIKQYKHIVVALHVPPFPEACWHEGRNTDDNFLPHFACKATGDVLKAAMLAHPEITMSVYCGHTHSPGFAQILPNLKVFTGGAEYRRPEIAGIVKFG